MYHNSPYINAKFKNFPWDNNTRTFVLGGEFVFILRKCTSIKLSYSNAEFQNFPGENTPDPRFRVEESLFSFSEIEPTLLQWCRIQKLSGGQYPGPSC